MIEKIKSVVEVKEVINQIDIYKAGIIGVGTTIDTLTLTVAGWTANSQTLTVTGVTTTSINLIVIESIVMGTRWGEAKVFATSQGTNSITFNCETTPTEDIEFKVTILN